LTYTDGRFELAFRPGSGLWESLAYKGRRLLTAGATAGFTVSIDGERTKPPQLISAEQEALPQGVRLRLQYVLRAEGGDAFVEYDVTQTFDLLAEPDRIERRLRIERNRPSDAAGRPPDRLLSATLAIDGLMPGDTAISVPMARLEPGTPLECVLRRPREFATHKAVDGMFDVFVTAPDTIVGTVAVDSQDEPLSVAVTPLPRECPVRTRLYGQHGRAVIEHEFGCESWLRDGEPLDIAAQAIHVSSQPWRDARRQVGHYLEAAGYAPPSDRPAWAKNAIIFEAELGFCGGVRGLEARLGKLQRLGFNAVYLMPWHRGGYGTIDYQEINPAYGTFGDLKRLTCAAHSLGMHVLFDLLVNIAADGSPYLAEHPDWFYRDESGRPLPHPAWKSNCFDPASPGFRRFLTDYAVRCCEEWGADGFRVDAVAYRGGLWNNRPGLQPHQHAHAVFTLVDEIRQAIRADHPERILMAECFGPEQVPISDLVCYQWIEWLDWALERVLSGRLVGAAVQRLLAEHFAVMPPGTWFTTYTHTHDTVAFAKRDLDGPAVAALFATLAFVSAGTMVFGGGWKMRARPSPEEAEQYRVLFGAKSELGGVAGSEVDFPASDEPALFIAERPSAIGRVHVITNFGDAPRALPVSGSLVYSRLNSAQGTIAAHDTVVVKIDKRRSREAEENR